MSKNTITRAQALDFAMQLLDVYGKQENCPNPAHYADCYEVLGKMLTSITKPRTKSDQPSKAAVENANLAAKVLHVLPQGQAVTSAWIGEHVPELPVSPTTGKVSVQKVTAVMRLLVDTGKVVKAKQGKVMTYTLL